MAIARKPEHNRSAGATHPEDESAAEAFISGGEGKPQAKGTKKIPILVRFDRNMLKRVDGAAQRRGVSRSSWIHFMISRALEQEEA
jgi:hypothetical protein